MKKLYRLNVNGDVFRNITHEYATKLINERVKTQYDFFYLYKEKQKMIKDSNVKGEIKND